MTDPERALPRAGWYERRELSNDVQEYWDGTEWTGKTRSAREPSFVKLLVAVGIGFAANMVLIVTLSLVDPSSTSAGRGFLGFLVMIVVAIVAYRRLTAAR